MKWNSENYERDRRNKHEYCQLSKTNSIQQDENVRTQNYVKNKLIMITQFKNWLKAKKSHDEELQMQN